MTTLKLNNTEFELAAFTRNTSFYENSIASTASCDIKVSDTDLLETLTDIQITSLQIKYDDNIIYNLDGINAKITNINEYLNTDHINTTIGLTFDME